MTAGRLFTAAVAALALVFSVQADEAAEGLAPDTDRLLESLAGAASDDEAQFLEDELLLLWRGEAGPTAELLLDRAELALDARRFDVARDLIDGVLDLYPDYAHGWAQSALVAYARDDYARALTDVDRALSLEPSHFEAHFALGLVLEALERWEGAFEAYSRALEIHPLMDGARARARSVETRARGREL